MSNFNKKILAYIYLDVNIFFIHIARILLKTLVLIAKCMFPPFPLLVAKHFIVAKLHCCKLTEETDLLHTILCPGPRVVGMATVYNLVSSLQFYTTLCVADRIFPYVKTVVQAEKTHSPLKSGLYFVCNRAFLLNMYT